MNSSPRTPQSGVATEPDLSGITLAHRAMVTDIGRLAELTDDIAERRRPCNAARARAITRYVVLMCESIHHHHTMEDDVLWPIIESCAAGLVDLTELTEDHATLDPRLDRLRELAAAFARDGADAARPLAGALADLHRLLDAHIADEERDLFPVIRGHVPVSAWQAVETAARKSGRLSFDGPRVLSVATEEERAEVAAAVPAPLMLLLRYLARRHRRLERAVFG